MGDTERRRNTPDGAEGIAAWLALKDRALDVAAEGITIADARMPDRPLIYVNDLQLGWVRARIWLWPS